MNIKLATISHAKEIHRIHTSAVRTTCKNFYTEKQIEAWLKGRSAEGYHKALERREMYVTEENGQITGFVHAIPGEIAAVYVDPAFHKKGVGKSLLDHGMKIASQGHKKVKVESTINAENFYGKRGFVKVQDSTVTRNGVEIPIVVMEQKKWSKISHFNIPTRKKSPPPDGGL